MSLAVRTGVRDDRKTSKLRTSPSISSNGSTSLVVGMFLDTLRDHTDVSGSISDNHKNCAHGVVLPLIDGLECGLVWDPVSLLQVQDEPGGPVGPLLRQVDPGRQAVPVKDDLIGSQQTTCRQTGEDRRSAVTEGFWSCWTQSDLLTCDRDNVQQPPHRLWADVTEPVLRHHQLCQVE